MSAAMGATLRVIIVDDHRAIRDELKRVIDTEDDMDTIAVAGDGEEGVRLAAALRPTVMLVDVSMPGMSGAEVTRAVTCGCPEVKVIAVTRHREPEFLSAMLAAGASGYILKQSASGELLRAVRAVAAGHRYIDTALKPPSSAPARVSDSTLLQSESAMSPLDEFEEALLGLVAASHSNEEIAERLSISTAEVLRVKKRAMLKAGLKTRVDIIAHVQAYGRRDV
jgi:DNA-binding NarL/FixJ family response regulator